MKNRVHTGLLLLVLAAGPTGCDGAHPPGPSAPSPQPQQTPPPTDIGRYAYNVADVLLSGVVYEVTPTGRVPIEGVLVRRITSTFSRRPTWSLIHVGCSASGPFGSARAHGRLG